MFDKLFNLGDQGECVFLALIRLESLDLERVLLIALCRLI